MTTKKKSAGKGRAKKLKLKKETIRDLAPRGSRKVKGGALALDTAISSCECTLNLCQTGNMFCNPMTLPNDCRTLNHCLPTFWACNRR